MLFVFLALITVIGTLGAEYNASILEGGPSGKYGVKISVYNHLCEELVYNGFSVTPWYMDCNENQQETWYDPESVSPGDDRYIEYQGHMNVGVAGAIQWNIAGDPDKSVIVYYRASNGNFNGENKVMVEGGSIHYDTAYPDMLQAWFSACDYNRRCNNPCSDLSGGQPGCEPGCADQSGAAGKKEWDYSDIENTDYRVTGWVDGGNNPHLKVHVENRDGSYCNGMCFPVIFHLDEYEICGLTLY